MYCGTPTFWQRGLWDSCFQNPSESSGHNTATRVRNELSYRLFIFLFSCYLEKSIVMLFEFRLKCLTGRMIFSTGMIERLDLGTYIDFGIFVSSTLIKAGISGTNPSNKSSYIV